MSGIMPRRLRPCFGCGDTTERKSAVDADALSLASACIERYVPLRVAFVVIANRSGGRLQEAAHHRAVCRVDREAKRAATLACGRDRSLHRFGIGDITLHRG